MTLPKNSDHQDNRDEMQPQANSVPKGSFSATAELKEPGPAGESDVQSVPKGS